MAPTTNTTNNYSIFAIPAYLMLAMAPHAYSSALLHPQKQSGKPKSDSNKPQKGSLYNMGNPRSSQNAAVYSNSLPPEVYAKFERARAAHSNMLENSAFFVSAILAGVVAKCDAAYMNRMASVYLASRVAYMFSYINVSHGPWAFMRTGWFTLGNVVLLSLWWEAGKKVMRGNY